MSTFGFAFAQPPPRQRKEQARIKALNQAAANKAANKNKPKSEKAVAFDLSSASEGSDGENENMVYGGGNSATSTAVPSPTDDLSCSSADSHSAATSSMSFYEAGGAHSSHSSQGGGLSSGQASSSAGGHVFNTNGVSAASAKRTHLARRGRAASGGGETLASTKTAYSMLNKGAGGGPLTSSAYLQNFIPGNSGVVGGDTTTTSNGGGSSATSTTTSASTATSGGPTVPVGIGGPGGIDTSLEPKPFQPVPSMRTSGHYSNGIAPFSVSAASTSSSSSGFSSVRGGGPGSYNNPDTAPIMLQSHSAASTGSKFHPSTSYPGSNSGGGNMISNPLLTNHLIPGNKKNANVLTRAGEYLLLNLTAMTTHEERKRVRDLGRITDPQLAIEMFFHRGHLQSILLLWRRRGSESDISRLCLAALEHCAQVIGVHAAKTRQASSGAPRYVYNLRLSYRPITSRTTIDP
ncbi:unnamed protein product [Amoebophrya sp. A25]|nr:unnamed protein product [Amoebophrya sp. A25]|eukprot:GSA25T00014503001.1